MAAEVTRNFLEEYDRHLHDSRDRKAYRDKGLRRSTVKTVSFKEGTGKPQRMERQR